jgi:hypothetical protein
MVQVTVQSMDEKLGRMVTRVVLPRVIMHSRHHYGVSYSLGLLEHLCFIIPIKKIMETSCMSLEILLQLMANQKELCFIPKIQLLSPNTMCWLLAEIYTTHLCAGIL